MPDKIQPVDPTKDPTKLAFQVESVRGYLFSAASEAAQGLREAGAAHAEAAVLTGAAEFVAQMWAQMAFRTKATTPQKARQLLEDHIRTFWNKHLQAELAGAEKVNPS